MGFIATCFTLGVQVHVRHMSCIVDVVKAVNAWVGGAFDNVLLRDESHESHLFIFGIFLCQLSRKKNMKPNLDQKPWKG